MGERLYEHTRALSVKDGAATRPAADFSTPQSPVERDQEAQKVRVEGHGGHANPETCFRRQPRETHTPLLAEFNNKPPRPAAACKQREPHKLYREI